MRIRFAPDANEWFAVYGLFVGRAGGEHFAGAKVFDSINSFRFSHDIASCVIVAYRPAAVNKKRASSPFEFGCRSQIRTDDLQVMSLAG